MSEIFVMLLYKKAWIPQGRHAEQQFCVRNQNPRKFTLSLL